ncbi:O-antigen ligase [Nocardioides sp. LS1]|uniref:O-antigen ligase family protein n=1 Tax=Nocardioides sp. LS1 TaxID=1027620 RepID=UPI00163993DA|nr:O-antigen ligase family protein [Nocardioides sp. LS1]
MTAAHLVAATFQSRGELVGTSGDPAARDWVLNSHRMLGFYNHPSTLGKTTFLLLFFLLPLTMSRSRVARGSAQIGIVLGFIASFLTVSRANVAASACAVLIWILINRKAVSNGARIATAVAVGAATFGNLGAISALETRNQADPTGGPRDQLLSIGLHQIADTPWFGVGANYYSEFVGRYDPYAATGFPVHNTFLLGVAELGIPLAVVFFSPVLLTVMIGWQRWQRNGFLDARTAAMVATVPGTLLITLTGWGMLSEASLLLWYAALGNLATRGPEVLVSTDKSSNGDAAVPGTFSSHPDGTSPSVATMNASN